MTNTLLNLAVWVAIIGSSALVVADLLPSKYTPQDVQVTHDDIDVTLQRFNDETVDIGLDVMKELVRNEHERFKDIDAKATTFIGMLSISLAVIASLGALYDKKLNAGTKEEEVTFSGGQKYFRKRIIWLYSLTLAFLLSSFFFAMLATRVATAPSPEFPGRHDVNPEVVIGEEYIGLDPRRYKKVLIGELAEVYETNVQTNNVKATWLSRSQLHAFVAGIPLVSISIMAIMASVWGPPTQKPNMCPATALPTRKRETKSA